MCYDLAIVPKRSKTNVPMSQRDDKGLNRWVFSIFFFKKGSGGGVTPVSFA